MDNRPDQTVTHDAVQPTDAHGVRTRFDGTDAGIIEDFIQHVKGVIPLLENVKASIEESSNRIPKASMQLSKVTEATESAAVEILNVVEAVISQIVATERELTTVKRYVLDTEGLPGHKEALASIAVIEQNMSETKDNSMSIAIALQVQDITSQQIAGVSSTIESIRQQLYKALKRFGDPGQESAVVETEDPVTPATTPTAHYDENAHFSKTPDRQNIADEIIKQWNKNNNVA